MITIIMAIALYILLTLFSIKQSLPINQTTLPDTAHQGLYKVKDIGNWRRNILQNLSKNCAQSYSSSALFNS